MTEPTLSLALSHHRAGRLAEALGIYQALLAENPVDPVTLGYCGLALLQGGSVDAAITILGQSVSLAPDRVEARLHYATALATGGSDDAAVQAFRQVLILEPSLGMALFNAAQVHDRRGDTPCACSLLLWGSVVRPGDIATWDLLGAVERKAGRLQASEEALLRALSLDPERALTRFHLGLLRADQGRKGEAEAAFRAALTSDPKMVEAATNLANLIRVDGRRGEARDILKAAIGEDRTYARAWSALAAVESDDEQPIAALEAADAALALDPRNHEAHGNRAQALDRLARRDEAIAAGRAAIDLSPDDSVLHNNLATYLLAAGRLEQGWDAYRWREKAPGLQPNTGLPDRRWTAWEPPGKRLLLVAEQGLGDEIMFATCLPDVMPFLANGRLDAVVVECDRRLIPLYERSFPGVTAVARLHSRDRTPAPADYSRYCARFDIDCWCLVGDLPRIFRQSVDAFPQGPSPFVAKTERVAQWRNHREQSNAERRIGIAWRSKAGRERGEGMYPDIRDLIPLLEIHGVELVSLQYDDPAPDLRRFEDATDHHVIQPPGLDTMNDLEGVIALAATLDAVVTARTSVMYLAGVAGVPCHVPSRGLPWHALGTGQLPWFPSVTLHERQAGQDWAASMREIAIALGA